MAFEDDVKGILNKYNLLEGDYVVVRVGTISNYLKAIDEIKELREEHDGTTRT
jgi:hypothetical protein